MYGQEIKQKVNAINSLIEKIARDKTTSSQQSKQEIQAKNSKWISVFWNEYLHYFNEEKTLVTELFKADQSIQEKI